MRRLATLFQRVRTKLRGLRPLFERALAIREKVLGPEHPDTKVSAYVTAVALDALGRKDKTAALRQRTDILPSAEKATDRCPLQQHARQPTWLPPIIGRRL